MRKLALPEEVLLQIEQPARYIGNEFNSVVKDKEKVALRGAFLFPDVYEIGMSHLGIQILYDMFNKREDMWCERVYSPWPDLDRVMREQSIPLFGLESQEPVKNEDFLFITLQYEMCYTNVLQALDLAGIPLHAAQIPKRGKCQNQHDRDEYGQLYHLKCLVFFHMKFPFRAFCAFATIPPSGVLWTAG